jgi:DNA-binding CsgD family transcriptional regulator
VLHRRRDAAVPIENGRYLAAHIPNAKFVELPGVEHTYFLGDQQQMLSAIRGFIDEHIGDGSLQTAVRRAERKRAYGLGTDALTPAERDVVGLIAEGLTNAQAAERLHVSPHTIDGRLRRVFAKLNVSTRVEFTREHARHAV